MRKSSFVPTEGKPQGGLKSWREVVTPHSDVVKGTYQQAEFAADLWQVYQNEGTEEYQNPTEFYRRTFITEGLKGLLTGALVRLAGKGGNPVVELQTNFGGGKTHSMMSLWHLFSGVSPSELLGVDELVKEAGVPVASGVHRAVLVGTKISPGQTHKKPDGTVDQWLPIIEKDVDGPNSLPLCLDRETPTLGRYSACRRVSRTIYMGSGPTQKAANRGIDDRQVKLGCVQPGEAVATFGDALRRLTDRATYLYVDGKRYWYSTQPTVTRLADDRASQKNDDDVNEEIVRRLRSEAGNRDAFSKVHACCASSDVPDERTARLVVLGPEFPHTAKNAASTARKEALAILESRGNSPRSYRNTLVMLAADSTRLKELQSAVRQFLAWDSIWDDQETLALDRFQTKQAETKLRTSDETVDARIPETFQWLLVPGQSDPKGDIEWTEIRLQGQDSLATRAAKKLKSEELLMPALGDVRLRHELDRVPLWRGNHVGVKQLAEDMAKYLYLPRLRDDDVLLAAIREGVAPRLVPSETFAYAERWDEQKKRYFGLSVNRTIRVLLEGESLVVKPDVAAAQLAADQVQQPGPHPEGTRTGASGSGGTLPPGIVTLPPGTVKPPIGPVVPPVVEPPKPRRFFGSVILDPIRLARDADRIAQEVVQHLSGIAGAEVKVTLEVHADIPDSASPEMVRTITENCRTLRFDPHGFEES